MELALPVAERSRFRAFAMRVLEGPPIEESLLLTMAMVLLLRFKDVEDLFPQHRLLHAITTAAQEVNTDVGTVEVWAACIRKSWIDVNESSLSIAQVLY